MNRTDLKNTLIKTYSLKSLQAAISIAVDRDGTLNETKPADPNNPLDTGYILNPSQWKFIKNADKGLALLAKLGYNLHIYTQQSGIGKGCMTIADLDAVHAYAESAVQKLNPSFKFGEILYCPHIKVKNTETGEEYYPCTCAKLKPKETPAGYLGQLGTLLEIIKLAPHQIIAIGDTERDIPAKELLDAGMIFIGVVNPAKPEDAEKMRAKGFIVADNLLDIALVLEEIKAM